MEVSRLEMSVAQSVIRSFARTIGLGYHCDTPMTGYEPKLRGDLEGLQSVHDWAFDTLAIEGEDRPYEVAADEWIRIGLTTRREMDELGTKTNRRKEKQ